MNMNTLRFGVIRTAAFAGVLLLGVVAGRVEAAPFTPTALTPSAVTGIRLEAQAALNAEIAAELKRTVDAYLAEQTARSVAELEPAVQLDLIAKAAAAAVAAPRGFVLVAPAALIAPTL